MNIFSLSGFLWDWRLIETGIKKNVLANQLFLELTKFMLGWSLYLSIIPETVSSSRGRVWGRETLIVWHI